MQRLRRAGRPIRFRRWVFTINNYQNEDIDLIKKLIENNPQVSEGIAEIEHQEEGKTPHIQGYLGFKNQHSRVEVEGLIGGRGWIEKAAGSWQQNFKYCSKENKVFAIAGHALEELNEEIVKKKIRIEEMIKDLKILTYKEAIDKYPVEYYKNPERMLRALNKAAMSKAEPWDGDLQMKNIWIWGKPGIGKSKWANTLCDPEMIMKKNVNKWWDGYDLFETRLVIIEDWPSKQERKDVLAQHLKVWGDRYCFIGECKGTHMQIDPGRFSIIITSNYKIEDCFENPEDIAALKRRFQEIEMTNENKLMISSMELPLTILKDYDQQNLIEFTSNE